MGAESSTPDDSTSLLESVEVVKLRRNTSATTEEDCRMTSDSDMDEAPSTPRPPSEASNNDLLLSSTSHEFRERNCWGGWFVQGAPFSYLQRMPLLTASPSSSVTSLETNGTVQTDEFSLDKTLKHVGHDDIEVAGTENHLDDSHSSQLPSPNIYLPSAKGLGENQSTCPALPELKSDCSCSRLRSRSEPMTGMSPQSTHSKVLLPVRRGSYKSFANDQPPSIDSLQSVPEGKTSHNDDRVGETQQQGRSRTSTAEVRMQRRQVPPLPRTREVKRAASEPDLGLPRTRLQRRPSGHRKENELELAEAAVTLKRRQPSSTSRQSNRLLLRAASDPNIRPGRRPVDVHIHSSESKQERRQSAFQSYSRDSFPPQRLRRGSADSVHKPFSPTFASHANAACGNTSSGLCETDFDYDDSSAVSRSCLSPNDALCQQQQYQQFQNDEAPVVYCFPEDDDDPLLASTGFCGIMDLSATNSRDTAIPFTSTGKQLCNQSLQSRSLRNNEQGIANRAQPCSQREYLFHQALLLESQGRLIAALECFENCLQWIKAGDGTLMDTAELYHKIGIVRWKTGAYEESLRVLTISLDIYQDLLGCSVHDDTMIMDQPNGNTKVFAEILISLGRVFLSLGDHKRAWRHFERSVQVLKCIESSRLGYTDGFYPVLARGLHGLGMVDEAKGRYTRAMNYFTDALHLQRSSLGLSHVDIASTLTSVGAIQEKCGLYNEAMDCYSQAIFIYRSDLSSSPVDIGVTLTSVGWIHYIWGDFESAMQAYSDALHIMTAVLGDDHRNVASIKFHIGLIYSQQGRFSEALGIYKDVLESQSNALGQEHLDIPITLDSISVAYEQLQQYEKAAAFLSRSLRIRCNALGKKHLHVGMTLERLGLVHVKKGDLHTAKMCYVDSLRVYQAKKLAKDDSRIRHVQHALREVEMWRQRDGKSI